MVGPDSQHKLTNAINHPCTFLNSYILLSNPTKCPHYKEWKEAFLKSGYLPFESSKLKNF